MGAALGLSRAAVHKHMKALVEQGLPIHRVPGRGYRLADGVCLLDEAAITNRLAEHSRELAGNIEILEEVDSTNAQLQRTMPAEPVRCSICLAEKQTAGRGRRGRVWIASPYRDLIMSIGIFYPQWPAQLPTLGLVTALLVAQALEELGVPGLTLKWPNDVVHENRKLCGVLLDVTGEAHGACRVVAGIGINVSMDGGQAADIDQHWMDIETIAGWVPDRNTLAAHCLNVLLPAFEAFPGSGFSPYRAGWLRLDALRSRSVAVHGADGRVAEGEAAGVDDSGRLRVVDASGRARVFTQGEVSVRVR